MKNMPAKGQTDTLWLLIQSLTKGEKRYIQLQAPQKTGTDELKFMQLFDALEAMEMYDEQKLFKNKKFKKELLHNQKSRLYRHILESLRNLHKDQIKIHLREQLDFAWVLNEKNLYNQCLKLLEKIKEKARNYHQLSYLNEAILMEQTITTLQVLPTLAELSERATTEIPELNDSLTIRNQLATLAMQTYYAFQSKGPFNTQEEIEEQKAFFKRHMPHLDESKLGFYEKLHLYQCCCWHYAAIRNHPFAYRYAKKWVKLFDQYPQMQEVEPTQYVKGFHNLLFQLYRLQRHDLMEEPIRQLQALAASKMVEQNEQVKVHTFVFLNTALLSYHILKGTFEEGIEKIPAIEKEMNEYGNIIGWHRIVGFQYRFAYLYYGEGKLDDCLPYLNEIIYRKASEIKNDKIDIICYARLLHLVVHYEMGNSELLMYLAGSVYRFMKKMKNLSAPEEAILKFLHRSFYFEVGDINKHLTELLQKMKTFEENAAQYSIFIYLDVVSWIESKLQNKPFKEIILEKHRHNKQDNK